MSFTFLEFLGCFVYGRVYNACKISKTTVLPGFCGIEHSAHCKNLVYRGICYYFAKVRQGKAWYFKLVGTDLDFLSMSYPQPP